METYILILLGKGVKTKTTTQDYCHGFYQGFSLILDQLQRLARRNHYENFTDSNNNEDPVIALLQSKYNLKIALSCPHFAESLVKFSEIVNTSSWLPFNEENGERGQLIDSLEQLKMMLQEKTVSNITPQEMDDSDNKENYTKEDDDNDDADDDDDSFVEYLHQLTDLLPNKGDAIVHIYWILPDCHNLNDSNTLPLFGALKRLQECHNALIEIVSSGPEILMGSFLDVWKKWLMFTVHKQDDLMLPDIPMWHGSLTYMGHEENKLLSLPGFALIHDTEKSRSLYLYEDRVDSFDSKPPLLLSNIQLLHFTPRNSIPLFLFLPFKLKLRLLYENDLKLRQFLQELKHTIAKGLCLLACITLKPKPAEASKSNLKSWMDFVLSSTGDEQQDCNNSINGGSTRRLCVIDRDQQDNVCIYPFRQAESINGGLYEHLESMTRGKEIVENSQEGSDLYLKDLTDHFLKDQIESDQYYLQEIRDQIGKLTNENNPLTSQSLCEIMISTEKSCAPNESSSSLSSQNSFHLDLSTTTLTNGKLRCSSDSITSPRQWRERLWLMHKDPAKLQARRKTLAVPIEDVFSLSAKDILKRFRRDGRPTKDDLSPLRPANKSVAGNYININTTEAAIQEISYPESLIKKFHGVEYCLDSSSSLSKDTQLSQTQNNVIRQETLSISSELIPRTFPKKRKPTAQLATKNKKLESSAKKEQRQNRSTKRKSPPTSQSSKQSKRKRTDSATSKTEISSELTKAQETRSQRHKRRLRMVVDKTLDENGINKDNSLYTTCSERLYALIKSFLKSMFLLGGCVRRLLLGHKELLYLLDLRISR